MTHLVLPAGNEVAERNEAPHHQHSAHAEDSKRRDSAGLGEGGEEAHGLALLGGRLRAARRQFSLAAIHAPEVIDQRLNRPNPRVRAVAGCDLSGKGLGDAGRKRDVLPPGRGDRPETIDEGLKDGAHTPFFPISGNTSIHMRERAGATLPTKRKCMKTTRFWRRRDEEETWTMTSPPARTVLAKNLRALMDAHPTIDGTPALERATAKLGGTGKGIGKSTLDRILKEQTPVNLDYIQVLAKVFGIDPWQLLVPGLDPSNPQILRSTGANEDALYRKLGELAQEMLSLSKEEDGGEGRLPAPRQDREAFPTGERRRK